MGNACVTSKSYMDERGEIIINDFKPQIIKEPGSFKLTRMNSTPFHTN